MAYVVCTSLVAVVLARTVCVLTRVIFGLLEIVLPQNCLIFVCVFCKNIFFFSQWCGEGLAAADVAYVICTSLEPSTLAAERELLEHYHTALSAGLDKRFGPKPNPATAVLPKDAAMPSGGGGGDTTTWYTFEQFMDDYRVSFLDYMRCEEAFFFRDGGGGGRRGTSGAVFFSIVFDALSVV